MAKSPLTELTPREREVLQQIAEGRTNAEIAYDLGIRFDTARWHVSEVLSKLGVASREEAAAVFRAEQRKHSLHRRLFAGIPALLAIGTTSAAVFVAIALFVSFAMDDGETGEEPQLLVAYSEHDFYTAPVEAILFGQDPAPLRVINAQTRDEMEFGPPSHYLAVRWEPGAKRLFAIAVELDEGTNYRFVPMLLEFPGGAVQRLEFEQTHGPPSRYDIASWSPDGSLMILRWGTHLLLCEPDGQLIRELDPGPGAGAPRWVPVWSSNSEHFGAPFGNQTIVFDRSGTRVSHSNRAKAGLPSGPVMSNSLSSIR